MVLQRQHFLLSYFKTLSVGPVGVSNSRPPALQPGAQPSELPVRGSRDPLLYTILSPKLKSAIIVTGSYHLPCLTLMVKGLYIIKSLSVQEHAGY